MKNNRIKEAVNSASSDNSFDYQFSKPHLTLEEASKYLGLSKSFLRKLTRLKLIPHYKPNGKMIYFLKSDLDQYIRRNRISTHEEDEKEAANFILKNKIRK